MSLKWLQGSIAAVSHSLHLLHCRQILFGEPLGKPPQESVNTLKIPVKFRGKKGMGRSRYIIQFLSLLLHGAFSSVHTRYEEDESEK